MKQLVKLPEPALLFGYNQSMEDPRDGLTLFGPLEQVDFLAGNWIDVRNGALKERRKFRQSDAQTLSQRNRDLGRVARQPIHRRKKTVAP